MNITLEGDTLVIRVDVGAAAYKNAAPSSTGKTRIIATSGGNQALVTKHGQVKVGVNVYRPL